MEAQTEAERAKREKILAGFGEYAARKRKVVPPALLNAEVTNSQLQKMCSTLRWEWEGGGQSSRLSTAVEELRVAERDGQPTDGLVRTLINVAKTSARMLGAHEARAARSRAPSLQRMMAGPGSSAAPRDRDILGVVSRVLAEACEGDPRWAEGVVAQKMATSRLLLSEEDPKQLPPMLSQLGLRFPTPPVARWTAVDKLVAFARWYPDKLVPAGVLVRWAAENGFVLDVQAVPQGALDVSTSISNAAGGAALSPSAAQPADAPPSEPADAPPSAALVVLRPPLHDAGAPTLFVNVPATIGGGTTSLPSPLHLRCIVWAQAPTQRGLPLWRVETVGDAGAVAAALFSSAGESNASPLDCPVLLAYASRRPAAQ